MFATTFLENQTALVTGAGRRLGRSVAEGLAAHGANVVIHYRHSASEAEEVAGRIRALGRRAWTVQADFAAPGAAEACFEKALKAAGTIEILINSASDFPSSRLDSLHDTELTESILVNAWAPFALARAFHRHAAVGQIINFLDTRHVDYDREHVAYHLAKRTLFAFTRMMAADYAPAIRVNAVAPGLVLPPEGKDKHYLASLAHTNPLQRHGDEQDVLSAVLFLLYNTFVTGQVIYVDGGRHMKGSFYG